MDTAILLTKLSQLNNLEFDLYNYYVDATIRSFENSTEEFNTCIKDLKELVGKQYDFSWLTENATEFGCNRREFKQLCDDVCTLLGNRIDEVCRHTRTPIITKPTKFEDYCPVSTESLVAYGNFSHERILIDGKPYNIIDTKLENTPYYSIYVKTIEL